MENEEIKTTESDDSLAVPVGAGLAAVAITKAVDLSKAELFVSDTMTYKINSWILDLEYFIDRLLKEGLGEDQIKRLILNDLNNGGRLFGALKNNKKNAVKDAIGMASREATMQVFEQAGVELVRWITVSSNPCPDCVARHGRVETMEYWRNVGLPKSGFSVCREHCKCRWVPESYKGEDLENPVILSKKKKP